MYRSSEITIEMLQMLLDSPRLGHLMNQEEKGVLLSAIAQISHLDECLSKTSEVLNKTVKESFL